MNSRCVLKVAAKERNVTFTTHIADAFFSLFFSFTYFSSSDMDGQWMTAYRLLQHQIYR